MLLGLCGLAAVSLVRTGSFAPWTIGVGVGIPSLAILMHVVSTLAWVRVEGARLQRGKVFGRSEHEVGRCHLTTRVEEGVGRGGILCVELRSVGTHEGVELLSLPAGMGSDAKVARVAETLGLEVR